MTRPPFLFESGGGRAYDRPPMTRTLVAVAVVLLAGCGGDEPPRAAPQPDGDAPAAAAPDERPQAAPEDDSPAVAVPDGGTQAGHGADRTRVTVPERDRTPPVAVVSLVDDRGATLATAEVFRDAQPAHVELDEPRVRGVTAGSDPDSGVLRARVSVTEEITCRPHAGGATFTKLRTRYYPPPQIERMVAPPGARILSRKTRARTHALVGGRCGPDAAMTAVRGQLWGDVVNGSGLEGVTRHIGFSYERR
jgi:hypothetical protein